MKIISGGQTEAVLLLEVNDDDIDQGKKDVWYGEKDAESHCPIAHALYRQGYERVVVGDNKIFADDIFFDAKPLRWFREDFDNKRWSIYPTRLRLERIQ